MKNMDFLISIRPMGKLVGVWLTHKHWSDRPENWGCADGSLLVILAQTISQLKRGVTGRQKRTSVRKDTKHGKPLDFDQALLWPSLPLQGFGHYLHLWVQLWWVGEQSTNSPAPYFQKEEMDSFSWKDLTKQGFQGSKQVIRLNGKYHIEIRKNIIRTWWAKAWATL